MKIKQALVSTLAVCMLVSGCSAGSAGTNKTPNQEANSTEVKESVTLTITWWGSQSRHDYTTQLLEKYKETHPNVTFEATPSGWEGYFDRLATQAAGNIMPDIIQMDYSQIATYAKNSTLADLQPFVDDGTINVADIDKNLLNTGKINDKLSGLVLSSSALAFIYNPEVFKNAGLDVPKVGWSWEDFTNTMIAIADKTGGYGVGKLEGNNQFPYWCRAKGVKLFAEDGTKLGYEDDQILVDFIDMMVKLQNAKALPTPDEWSQISTKGKEAEPVVTGEGAGTFDWSNFAVIARNVNPNLELITPPGNDNNALYIKPGMFFSVAENSPNKAAAAEFIDWFINSEEANAIINAERGVPVSSKIRDYLKTNLDIQNQKMFEYIDLVTTQSSQADSPEPVGASEVIKSLTDNINLVLYGQSTSQDAAANFRKQANEILARKSAK